MNTLHCEFKVMTQLTRMLILVVMSLLCQATLRWRQKKIKAAAVNMLAQAILVTMQVCITCLSLLPFIFLLHLYIFCDGDIYFSIWGPTIPLSFTQFVRFNKMCNRRCAPGCVSYCTSTILFLKRWFFFFFWVLVICLLSFV